MVLFVQVTITPGWEHNGLKNREAIYLGPHQCTFYQAKLGYEFLELQVKQMGKDGRV